MIDRLHEIRAAHAEEMKNMRPEEYARPFPKHCANCGAEMPQSLPGELPQAYRIVGIVGGEGRNTKATIESPPCPNCGKTSIFEY
jgi:hypothetical protein